MINGYGTNDPLQRRQAQPPIGPDIAAQYAQPQFMNIIPAQMPQDQQQQDGGGVGNLFKIGAALLAKKGLGGSGGGTDSPLKSEFLPMKRMGGGMDYA